VPDLTITLTNPPDTVTALELKLLGRRNNNNHLLSFSIDVTVVEPHAFSARPLAEVERNKMEQYKEWSEENGHVVLPFAISSSSELGPVTSDLLRFLVSLNPQDQIHNTGNRARHDISWELPKPNIAPTPPQHQFVSQVGFSPATLLRYISLINEQSRALMKIQYEKEVLRIHFLVHRPSPSPAQLPTSLIFDRYLFRGNRQASQPHNKLHRVERGLDATTWCERFSFEEREEFRPESDEKEKERENARVKDAHFGARLRKPTPSRFELMRARRKDAQKQLKSTRPSFSLPPLPPPMLIMQTNPDTSISAVDPSPTFPSSQTPTSTLTLPTLSEVLITQAINTNPFSPVVDPSKRTPTPPAHNTKVPKSWDQEEREDTRHSTFVRSSPPPPPLLVPPTRLIHSDSSCFSDSDSDSDSPLGSSSSDSDSSDHHSGTDGENNC